MGKIEEMFQLFIKQTTKDEVKEEIKKVDERFDDIMRAFYKLDERIKCLEANKMEMVELKEVKLDDSKVEDLILEQGMEDYYNEREEKGQKKCEFCGYVYDEEEMDLTNVDGEGNRWCCRNCEEQMKEACD